MKTNITETAIHMDVLSLSNWQLLTSSFEHMFGLPSGKFQQNDANQKTKNYESNSPMYSKHSPTHVC
jgi:hypothetical protein